MKAGNKVILVDFPLGISCEDVLRYGLRIGDTYEIDQVLDDSESFIVFLKEEREVDEDDSKCGIFFTEDEVILK